MNTEQLRQRLAGMGIDSSAYSLSGGLPNESYVLSRESNDWAVYYSERGHRTGEKRYASESDACAALLKILQNL